MFRTSIIGVFVLGAAMMAGCESIALMPRPDIDDTGTARNRVDRSNDIGRIERERSSSEVIGTVQRVDEARNEIHLSTRGSGPVVFRYDRNTLVYDRNRDLRVEQLRSGDEVAVRPAGNSNYERYAGVIRLVDRGSY